MVIYLELQPRLEEKFREQAMKEFGYSKGALKEAAEEAIHQWLFSLPKVRFQEMPLSAFRGILRKVKADSVSLKHKAIGLFTT